MSETKQLGKIQSVSFGMGGYQEGMIGIDFMLGSDDWGTTIHKGFWGPLTEITDSTQWTHHDRNTQYADLVHYIGELLSAAKVRDVSELKNIPIEAIFENNVLKSWRILGEVI